MTISFKTTRLNVSELSNEEDSLSNSSFLNLIPEILTPKVVENLPPYFHGIYSITKAEVWLQQMFSDSRLFLVQINDVNAKNAIGFIFVNDQNKDKVHIGYLLAEEYWGKGLATELLQEFIKQATKTEPWLELVAGVDKSNFISAKLLRNLGFKEQRSVTEGDAGVVFYEYYLR